MVDVFSFADEPPLEHQLEHEPHQLESASVPALTPPLSSSSSSLSPPSGMTTPHAATNGVSVQLPSTNQLRDCIARVLSTFAASGTPPSARAIRLQCERDFALPPDALAPMKPAIQDIASAILNQENAQTAPVNTHAIDPYRVTSTSALSFTSHRPSPAVAAFKAEANDRDSPAPTTAVEAEPSHKRSRHDEYSAQVPSSSSSAPSDTAPPARADDDEFARIDHFVVRLAESAKVVTVGPYNKTTLIHIREFYSDGQGNRLPSKRGITLTPTQFRALAQSVPVIEAAIRASGHSNDVAQEENGGDDDWGIANNSRPSRGYNRVAYARASRGGRGQSFGRGGRGRGGRGGQSWS